MKHLFTFILLAFLFPAQAQFVLVGWDFPDDSADPVADTGISANQDREISTFGETSAIEYKNGFEEKAAQATEWDLGAMTKGWEISFTTLGYYEIRFTSRQTSGGTNPGPRYWMIRYKVGDDGTWTDLENSDYEIANDWTTGYIEDMDLPTECSNQEIVYLQWVMTSNEATGGGTVEPTGTSKIDNILVMADAINNMDELLSDANITIGPVPASSHLDITWDGRELHYTLTDLAGRCISAGLLSGRIPLGNIPEGLYILRLTGGQQAGSRKIIVK